MPAETRDKALERLERRKSELIQERAQLPGLRDSVRFAIESHIGDCNREISLLDSGQNVADGELAGRYMRAAVDAYNEALDYVRELEADIQDIESDLADAELWKEVN